jgi:hypothetical protein
MAARSSGVIVGTAAFRVDGVNESFLEQVAGAIGAERLIIALDSKDGRIVVKGWLESRELKVDGIDHDLVRRIATRERKATATKKNDENVFSMMRRIGQAKAGLAADYAAQLARSAGKVVFFAKHIDVMDVAEETFAKRGIRYSSIRGDQTSTARQKQIDAFVTDPDVHIAVCSLTAAGVGVNLQVASNIVLAELSWTNAEQTQAIDRSHRIGQAEPVTAWRIIAAQTIDPRIAELIDSKAGLAARALDGSDEEVSSSADVQLEALVALLTDALRASSGHRDAPGRLSPGRWGHQAHVDYIESQAVDPLDQPGQRAPIRQFGPEGGAAGPYGDFAVVELRAERGTCLPEKGDLICQ